MIGGWPISQRTRVGAKAAPRGVRFGRKVEIRTERIDHTPKADQQKRDEIAASQ